MSENVYSLQNGKDLDKLNKNLGSEGYKVIEDSIERSGKGVCCMAVYKHSSNGNVVLAIKGTDFANASDLVNDLSMIIGGKGSRYSVVPTQNAAKARIQKYRVNLVTGHSLGGYMTEILATNNKLMGIAFCAPGTNGPITKLGGKEVRGFHNINFEHDPAGNVMVGTYTHVHWSIYVSGSTHAIADMVKYFANKKHITNMNVQSKSGSYMTGYYYPK